MDFGWSEEQALLRSTLARLGRDLPPPSDDGCFPRRAWQQVALAGVFALGRPQPGQRDPDLLTAVAGLEALAREARDNGLLFAVVGQIASSVYPLAMLGDEGQKARYLEALCDGTLIGASAVTEAEAGSDVAALRCTFRRSSSGYALEGAKAFVTSAPEAGLFLVLCRDGDQPQGPPRLGHFLVERSTPGLTVGPVRAKMGLDSSPMAELVLDGCQVPAQARLGPEGAGAMQLQAILEWERILLMATHVGTMERVLQETLRQVRQRRQGGRRLVEHQQVGSRLADAHAALQASRLLVYHAAYCKGGGRSAPLEAAVVKLFVGESYAKACLLALQLHGASGYMRELGLEGQVRDALAATLYAGTSEVQRNLIASLL